MAGKSRTASQHSFAQIPAPQLSRSVFNRSNGLKTAFKAGTLIPVFVDEALPGDTFALRTTVKARIATLLQPIMDNVYMDIHFFAVPNRLLWDNWEKFMGAQDNPGDSTDYLVPNVPAPTNGWAEDSIGDYFGIPTKIDLSCSALPFRAYNLIYNEWYRDQNLINSVPTSTGDGPDVPTDYKLLNRGKRHDYFSSALPWPQKGDPVTISLGDQAPLVWDQPFWGVTGTGAPTFNFPSSGNTGPLAGELSGNMVTLANINADNDVMNWASPQLNVASAPITGYADLSQAEPVTVNALRQAFQVQRLLERDARGGTRYIEIIKAHFRIDSPDARLQRPEWLGGFTKPLFTVEVPNTAGVSDGDPQANLAAYGVVQGQHAGFRKSFTEHCTILGLVSVRADLNYQQGLDRMWSRRTRYDFFWPTLQHLGEQEVLNKEIYAQGDANDDQVFGYQERYAEYRYKPSKITGRMRSNATQSLDIWHLAQDFQSLPVLGQTFIEENPPIDRVVAIPTEPNFIADFFFEMKTARPMPTFSVPGLIDHF